MRTFVDRAAMGAVVDDLIARGWMVRSGDRLDLTGEGRAGRESLLARVTEVRERATAGAADEQYRQLIETLQRMVTNLE
jgi:DNA-binding MarR family transcriptional regulator